MKTRVVIDPTDRDDRWRYVCPAGHRSWEATNHHYWCKQCAENPDPRLKPEFDELRDLETNRMLARNEVSLKGYRAKTA